MSWNGTVRCSYCGEKGHNRRGCPSLKKRLEQILAMPEDARNYDERCLVSEFERKKRNNVDRKCSYCGERGHNRRTCEVLAKHRDYVQKQQVRFLCVQTVNLCQITISLQLKRFSKTIPIVLLIILD